MKSSYPLFATASAVCARQTNAKPAMYTNHVFQWGGKGYHNSRAQAIFNPGKCPDPTGQLTIKCSGGELVIVDPSVNPLTLKHDCVMDPTDKTKATCSSSGTLSSAAAECRGNSKDELKLQLTLNKSTVSCEADGTSAKSKLYLATRCDNWVDLDDKCSAVKEEKTLTNDRYMCYQKGYTACSDMTCTASIGEVTVTSIGQDDPKCVHSIETATATGATPASTTTTGATPAPTSTSTSSETTTSIAIDTSNCESESTFSSCESDAITDTQGKCVDNYNIDFDMWKKCYKTIQDCDEVTRSICSMKHCCLDDFIQDIGCHTGCKIDCSSVEDTMANSIYLPEACLNLPDENIETQESIEASESTEGSINLLSENSSSIVRQHMLAVGIVLITSLLV